MKSKTIIASLLLLAASSLASFACDCNDAKKVEENPETAPQYACADNTDTSAETPAAEETPEEN